MGSFKELLNQKTYRLCHELSDCILRLFFNLSRSYIYEKRDARKPNTNSIKYNLVRLGHELNFRVYANGLTPEQKEEQRKLHGFVCREFLYDVHWYIDKKGEFYTPENVTLVVESELGDRRKGDNSKMRNPAVKFDFQKLLLANAGLRLMIFKVKNIKHLLELDSYFDNAISSYIPLKKGSAFLFICFVHDERTVFYAEKFKV